MTDLFDLTLQVAEKVAHTYQGDATGGTNTTLVDSNLAGLYPNDFFKGGTLFIRSGNHAKDFPIITGYTGASGTFAFANIGLTIGDTFEVTLPPILVPGAATVVGTNTLTAGALAGIYADDEFNGQTLTITSGNHSGLDITVVDYIGATGQFLFANIDIAAGDAYTAARINFPRDQLIQAVNAGLRAMGPWLAYDDTLLTVADQEGYALPQACRDVRRVQVGDANTDPFDWAIHYWWKIHQGRLIFDYHIPSDTGKRIRLWHLADLPALDTPDDQIPINMPVERLVWEAALAAFKLRTRLVGDDDPVLSRDIQDTQKTLDLMRYRYPVPQMPRDPHLANV